MTLLVLQGPDALIGMFTTARPGADGEHGAPDQGCPAPALPLPDDMDEAAIQVRIAWLSLRLGDT